MSVYDYNPDSGLPHDQPAPDTDEAVTALREAATAERYRTLDAKPGYAPGLYAVRLPGTHDGFIRSLALCRQHGDYDRAERTWHIGVAVPGAASARVLEELAGLGAVITKHDQEDKP